jgi:hypothetical protein
MDRPEPAQPGPTEYSLGPGGQLLKTHWAGRARCFVGLARPDHFIFYFSFSSTFLLLMDARNY